MAWKDELQLRDLGETQKVELTCNKCGLLQSQPASELANSFECWIYLGEIEAALTCRKWGCEGTLRLTISNEVKIEAFQGGLA